VKSSFVVPKRISLQADPARCTEVLDDLYTNYYALEVGLATVSIVCARACLCVCALCLQNFLIFVAGAVLGEAIFVDDPIGSDGEDANYTS